MVTRMNRQPGIARKAAAPPRPGTQATTHQAQWTQWESPGLKLQTWQVTI